MIGPKLIETLVAVLTIGSGSFALFLLVDLFRLRRQKKGPAYKGGIGQWSWAAHRITGVGVVAFLFGHIVDTFGVGLGGHFYNETVTLYKQWWFNPFEVLLIGAVLYHALNGLRIILFDFWPGLALRQKTFAYVEFALFAAAFFPAAVIMLHRAYQLSPLAR
ncbi:MAG TPA: succinate dehydrogenase, cytochrome b556 subunit [Actinomycetota bacterium]|jgi:succinate dehydrogenase / fumarate reductase cytochrome b subunit|nr:succinate dehydrogenase, cytochrome b556 subunit [Actinomycetota bacterium]